MKRHLLAIGLAALLLSACGAPEEVGLDHAVTMDVAAAADVTAAATEEVAATEAVAPEESAVETATPLEWTYERTDKYQEFALVRADGGALPGEEFEQGVMCQNVFEAAEYNMWALKNLVITGTRPGMTSFAGLVDGAVVEVSLVVDEQRRVPTRLLIGATTIARCNHSLAYP